MAAEPGVSRSAVFGGSAGDSFDDSHEYGKWGPVRQVVVRHGDRIDFLGLAYENGKYVGHGGSGGKRSVINLAVGESIVEVSGRCAKHKGTERVSQLTFVTSEGRRFSFGGGGTPFPESKGDAVIPSGQVLLYVFGRSGSELDRVGFGVGPAPESLPTKVTRSDTKGGGGGTRFDDLAASGNLLGKITRLVVRHGRVVDNLRVFYEGSGDFKHGGGGGSESEFKLDDDEWITEVRGRSGDEVDRIQFVTSKKRWSPEYGGGGGKPFVLKAGSNHVVKSFFGRSGSRLDQVGVFWEDAKPTRIEVVDLVYDMANVNLDAMTPVFGADVLLINESDSEQKVSKSTTISVSESHSTSVSETYGESVEVTFTNSWSTGVFGTGSESELSIAVGYSYEKTETTEHVVGTERTEEFLFSASVPPQRTVKATGMVLTGKYDVPWTATAHVYYQNLAEPKEETIHGVQRGVAVGRIDAKYETVDPPPSY